MFQIIIKNVHKYWWNYKIWMNSMGTLIKPSMEIYAFYNVKQCLKLENGPICGSGLSGFCRFPLFSFLNSPSTSMYFLYMLIVCLITLLYSNMCHFLLILTNHSKYMHMCMVVSSSTHQQVSHTWKIISKLHQNIKSWQIWNHFVACSIKG